MKTVLLLLLVGACAGPGQTRLAETPTAKTKATPSEAPPASNSDEDRQQVTDSFDSMRDAQQAHHEAANTPETTPTKPGPPPPPGTKLPPAKTPASPEKK